MLEIKYVHGDSKPWKVIEVFDNKVIAEALSQAQARDLKQNIQNNGMAKVNEYGI